MCYVDRVTVDVSLRRQAMAGEDFVEAILLWNENGASQAISDWLMQRALNSTPMQKGLLVAGTKRHFAEAFNIDQAEISYDKELPLPQALRRHVASVAIPKIRRPHR